MLAGASAAQFGAPICSVLVVRAWLPPRLAPRPLSCPLPYPFSDPLPYPFSGPAGGPLPPGWAVSWLSR